MIMESKEEYEMMEYFVVEWFTLCDWFKLYFFTWNIFMLIQYNKMLTSSIQLIYFQLNIAINYAILKGKRNILFHYSEKSNHLKSMGVFE